MEYSIVNFSQLDKTATRFDPEYYQPTYLKMYNHLTGMLHKRIGDFSFVLDGIHASIDYDEDSEILVLSAKAPKENYFDFSGLSRISKKQDAQYPRTRLRANDVIISSVGTIGNCGVVDASMLPANADRHVGIVRIKQDFKPRYLSTFLLSKYGRFQTLRESTGNVQLNLFIYKIQQIVVPYLSDYFQTLIENSVLLAHQLLQKSKSLYHQAEQTLLTQLGLIDWRPKHQLSFVQNYAEVEAAERLDAEYYRPKYNELFEAIRKTGQAIRLGDYLKQPIQRGLLPEYVEDGDIPVINSKHVGKTQITLDDNRYTSHAFANQSQNKRGIVKQFDVLLNSTGYITIGRCQPMLENTPAFADGHVAIIRPKSELDPVYLGVYLNAMTGQLQTERGWTGSSGQIELRSEVVSNYAIWKAPSSIQQTIRQYVENSAEARKTSKQLLDLAKRAVEIAIEQDEMIAENWLKEQMEKTVYIGGI